MNILTLGNNYCTRILSEKLAENTENKIFSTTNGKNVSFVDIPLLCFENIIHFIKENNIELVVPVDFKIIESEFSTLCIKENISIFAPFDRALNITGSKSFAKKFFYKNNIPTPKFIVVEKIQSALEYIKNVDYPIVLKPDCHSENLETEFAENYIQAKKIVDKFWANDVGVMVIEEFVEGVEFSAYAITDGFNIKLIDLISTKNNRYAYLGSNHITKEEKENIVENYFKPIILSLAQNDSEYVGIIGIDFIKDRNGEIYALECNPFFENLDIELFTRAIEFDLVDMFENVLLGTFIEKYKKIELNNKNYVSFVNDNGKIETYEGRTLSEAIEFSECEELKKELLWKF